MSFDSDVALVGTGIAPLLAARRLMEDGKRVLVLNPDWDFFSENSELPLDPLFGIEESVDLSTRARRIQESTPEKAMEILRPEFPGAIELWSGRPRTSASAEALAAPQGYHDFQAPHVRSRSRLWVSQGESWKQMESFYLEASESGFNPQLLEDVMAVKSFPGMSPRSLHGSDSESQRGIMIPRLCDFDVYRYRNGLLEFLRERLETERLICGASQLELISNGVRFYYEGAPRTARVNDGILIFWTPKLTQWILTQAKRLEAKLTQPKGVRLWEQWSLLSREQLDPGIIGIYEDMAVWAELEGVPQPEKNNLNLLSILRRGDLLPLQTFHQNWASSASFASLAKLCYGFLRWDRFSIRSMKTRAVFEWPSFEDQITMPLMEDRNSRFKAWVVGNCDGPLTHVIRTAKEACTVL